LGGFLCFQQARSSFSFGAALSGKRGSNLRLRPLVIYREHKRLGQIVQTHDGRSIGDSLGYRSTRTVVGGLVQQIEK
jgi:hypothetical protein